MSATFDTWLNYFYTENWDAARGQWANMTADIALAQSSLTGGDLVGAIQSCINALTHTDNGRLKLLDTYQYGYPRYRLFYLLTLLDDRLDVLEASPPITVDMAAIINAMLAAKFSELQYFIGIEDAYRTALWNAPFNVDFYAALARGFQKWP